MTLIDIHYVITKTIFVIFSNLRSVFYTVKANNWRSIRVIFN